jgi:hypothetical protein
LYDNAGNAVSGVGAAALKFILEDVFNDGLKAAVTTTVRGCVVSGRAVVCSTTFGAGFFSFFLLCEKADAAVANKIIMINIFFMAFVLLLLYFTGFIFIGHHYIQFILRFLF